ncbi:MAG: L-ribulose-5-phosphate 3-epimerase [Phycisphaerales bacterium]|jgi:L-ribulose-5-phosphate 3-epimerase
MPTNRRTFLGSLAAAAVAPSLLAKAGQPLGQASAKQTRWGTTDLNPEIPAGPTRVRMALKYGMIGEGDTVEARFNVALEAGFEGVELDAPSDLDLDEVNKAQESTGLRVTGVVDSVHWSKPLSHPDAAVRTEGRHGLEKAILDCKAVGGTMVLLVPAVVNGGTSYKDAWNNSITEIQRVLPIAKENGVRINLENVWNNFLLSPIETLTFINKCLGHDPHLPARSHQALGAYFDIGNIWNTAWPQHWVEVLGHHIQRLDIKGYSREIAGKQGKWAGFGPKIGDGDLPWDDVSDALKKMNYRGWATAEVGGGDTAHLTDVCERMHRVLKNLNA